MLILPATFKDIVWKFDIHIFTIVSYSPIKKNYTTVSFTFYHYINSVFVYLVFSVLIKMLQAK